MIESQIWEIQDLPYFIDGRGVGGNTLYESFCDRDIIDIDNPLQSINDFKDKITHLLGKDDNKTSHIDIKRILLFYVVDNKAFWNQQTPWYYNNYETSSWKRIVRSKHFISFYKEFHASSLNLSMFLEKKRDEFFKQSENRVLNRNDKQWSHRKLIILYDLLSQNGGIWDSAHENVALWKNNDSESKEEIFIGQETIWKGTRYYDPKVKVCLSEDWQKILKEKYQVQIIDFEDNKALVDEHAEV